MKLFVWELVADDQPALVVVVTVRDAGGNTMQRGSAALARSNVTAESLEQARTLLPSGDCGAHAEAPDFPDAGCC